MLALQLHTHSTTMRTYRKVYPEMEEVIGSEVSGTCEPL